MGNMTYFDDLINEKLMSVHTAFCAKILSISGDGASATIQPLNNVKQYGKAAQKQSVLKSVPILKNARFKLEPYKLRYVSSVNNHIPTYKELETVERKELSVGDTVYCICADRDISETAKGVQATPSVGRHHNMSDAVIVGVLAAGSG